MTAPQDPKERIDEACKVAERLGVAEAAGLAASPLTHREGAATIRSLVAEITTLRIKYDEALDLISSLRNALAEGDSSRTTYAATDPVSVRGPRSGPENAR